MLIKITNRECATILAALRRWHSYPAVRTGDSIATNKRKYRPLDDGEIQRLCKRITKRDGAAIRRCSNNGSVEKRPKLGEDEIDPENPHPHLAKSSLTIFTKPVGAWAGSQPLILRGERYGSSTHSAATEGASSSAPTKSSPRLLNLNVRCQP